MSTELRTGFETMSCSINQNGPKIDDDSPQNFLLWVQEADTLPAPPLHELPSVPLPGGRESQDVGHPCALVLPNGSRVLTARDLDEDLWNPNPFDPEKEPMGAWRRSPRSWVPATLTHTMELLQLLLRVCLVLLCSTGPARSVTITSLEPSFFARAQGEKVTLPCTFNLSEEDEGPLDIEWVLIPADKQNREQTIIMYTVDRIYNGYYTAMTGRVQFTNLDPRSGDASLDIQNLKAADTGTYQCKVKKVPGVESRKIQLSVLVKPGKTECSIEGSQEIGKDITLKCASQEGSPLLSYNWRRVPGTQELPDTSMLNEDSGELLLKNASEEYSGMYSCVASNSVGTDECSVELHVAPPINTASIIVGAVIGTLLSLSVLTSLICCWCKKHREKKYEEEVHNDIKMDASPPKHHHHSSARIYIGSTASSLGSMSPSNMEGHIKSPTKVPSENLEHVPSQNATFALSKIAAPNSSEMGAVPVMIPATNQKRQEQQDYSEEES
ncbi:Coxsackievirus and adenovirus receptor like protein [Willisornis vidua]|uniref:Coxsackievirus and adenovirus receptor like protein n=1 Tax=Willisornis vidua TaxID=1566151 RepID=A0ABQ9CQ55_9PASS|nr:Coxsackievirus and adenovirus receptor like protein [Willisornis vidua]